MDGWHKDEMLLMMLMRSFNRVEQDCFQVRVVRFKMNTNPGTRHAVASIRTPDFSIAIERNGRRIFSLEKLRSPDSRNVPCSLAEPGVGYCCCVIAAIGVIVLLQVSRSTVIPA